MSQFQINNRYAKAAYQWVSANKLETKMLEDMQNILATKNKESEVFFARHSGRQSLLLSTVLHLTPSLSKEAKKFMRFLASKKRINLIFGIAKQFIEIFAEKSGEKTAKLISAKGKMDTNFVNKVQEILKKRNGITYKLNESNNSKLIGGFQIVINNTVIDYSIAHKLNELKKNMKATS